ncbi:MAG: glycosyltransferase family 2 protein [bacterium]
MESDYKKTKYYRVGRATDLEGSEYKLYRCLEILPGAVSWLTLILLAVLSYFIPFYCAIGIIAFDFYWFLKTIYFSLYLRASWKKIQINLETDWRERLSRFKYTHIHQMVILPFYNEDREIIEKSLDSLINSDWNHKKIIVVLAGEERAKDDTKKMAEEVVEKYAKKFGHFVYTIHPAGQPDEMPGKGSNIAYAIEKTRIDVLDKNGIAYEDVLVSAFDIDTIVYPGYFLCLTWNFLISEHPYRTSFQPVPVFNNNIWESPAISRVVASSGSFWQMMQQERPEKLATFSSHSVCFKTIYDAGFWQKNIVSEDSRIFWNSLLAFDGDYRTTPIYYPVSMDGNLAPTLWQTAVNVYKQQRRWAWGAENFPYIVFGFIKNKKIPFWRKFYLTSVVFEGLWSWSTNSLIIFVSGWLPIILGGSAFSYTVISYNLPVIIRDMAIFSMLGLFLAVLVSMSFLPPKPADHKNRFTKMFMVFQWVLVPFTVIVFGSIPALDAQTRLMFGKYMGFWVTPKHRAGLNK